jgi:4-hydroxymandelate oxidase
VIEDAVSLFDLERLAEARVSKMAWDYYASGAADEITLRENRVAFDRLRIHYRVLVDVSALDLGTTVLGRRVSMPVLVAPTAFHALAHPDGETATVHGAGAAGTVMILSTLSNTAVEDVVAAASGPVWFQLYVYTDRGATEALVRRVERAGCEALVLTVDAPRLGRRERDMRNAFRLPEGLSIENMTASGLGDLPKSALESGLASYFASLIDSSLSWKDLEWLRSLTSLPIVIKGIVRADDAVRAAQAGASAVVVSNHGARQLDTSPATIDALPRIAEAVTGSGLELLLDGGVRRGTDVVKALALGARAVLLGRPILWGLAAGGREGVEKALSIVRSELEIAMALAGAPNVGAITRDLVEP